MKIVDIMSKSVKTVGSEESARSVYEKFNELGIHHIPVVDGGKLVGILSTNDYRGVTRGASKVSNRFPSKRMSMGRPFRCPPLMKT